jgi:uncharacterized protein
VSRLRKIFPNGEYLGHADGCVVGSSLKVDGCTWNPVDPGRAKRFVNAAGSA